MCSRLAFTDPSGSVVARGVRPQSHLTHNGAIGEVKFFCFHTMHRLATDS